MANTFTCPHCYKKQRFIKSIQMNLNKNNSCDYCRDIMKPLFTKRIRQTYKFAPIVGPIIGLIIPNLMLHNGFTIFVSLSTGLFLGIAVILIYMYWFYATTQFEK